MLNVKDEDRGARRASQGAQDCEEVVVAVLGAKEPESLPLSFSLRSAFAIALLAYLPHDTIPRFLCFLETSTLYGMLSVDELPSELPFEMSSSRFGLDSQRRDSPAVSQ